MLFRSYAFYVSSFKPEIIDNINENIKRVFRNANGGEPTIDEIKLEKRRIEINVNCYDYDEYINRPKIKGLKYHVIVAPGEGDISANDPDVISTLLLRH